MTMRKTALLATAAALVACNGGFNKPALLDQPRILAVKAEPAEPSFNQSTTLSTLLYQPPLDRPSVAAKCPTPGATTYHWSWCPWPMSSNTQYDCPISQAEFDQIYAGLGLGAAPSLDLGTSETATFTNPFPAQRLYDLCRGDISSSLGGESADGGAGHSIFNCDLPAEDYNTSDTRQQHPIGFKVTIKVEITPACPGFLPAGFDPLVALYSLHLPTDDNIPVNNNPVLPGIWVTQYGEVDGGAATVDAGDIDGGVVVDAGAGVDGGVPTPDGGILLDDQASVMVARNKHVALRLDVSIDTAEHLAVPGTIDYDSTNNLTRHYEHLAFSWYAEAGDFTGRGEGRNTGYLPTAYPPGVDLPPQPVDDTNFEFNTANTWDLPKTADYPDGMARIIVVVRDGRGGVDWTSKLVSLEGQP
jgi:hypothetical protein